MEIQQTKYPVLAATLKCKMTSAASSLFSTKIQNCTADLASRQMIRYLERNGDEWFCFVWVVFSPTCFLYCCFVVTEELNIQVVLGEWDPHVLDIEVDETREHLCFIWICLMLNLFSSS